METKTKNLLLWGAGLILFILLAPMFSRILAATMDAPPLLMCIIFGAVLIVAVLVLALLKKIEKRWRKLILAVCATIIVFIICVVKFSDGTYREGYLFNGSEIIDESGEVVVGNISKYNDVYYLKAKEEAKEWECEDFFICVRSVVSTSSGSEIEVASYDVKGKPIGEEEKYTIPHSTTIRKEIELYCKDMYKIIELF